MSKQGATISENIKKYRNKFGISQDVLSKKANLAFHTIAKIESGERRLDVAEMKKFAALYKKPTDYFLK